LLDGEVLAQIVDELGTAVRYRVHGHRSKRIRAPVATPFQAGALALTRQARARGGLLPGDDRRTVVVPNECRSTWVVNSSGRFASSAMAVMMSRAADPEPAAAGGGEGLVTGTSAYPRSSSCQRPFRSTPRDGAVDDVHDALEVVSPNVRGCL
jgi:hypothetical protein